ncbi:MAG: hypothetical protein QXZ14_06200, partial [Candidatus Jordarchaeales archaeon]
SLLPKVVNLLQIVSIAPVQYLPSIIKNAINLIGRPINTFVRKSLPSLSKEQLEKLKEKMVEIGLLEAPVNGS